MHIGIPSWCSIRCLFIRVRLWIVVVATLPWLELEWYIWVTNRWYEYGAKFWWTQHCLPWKQELTPSCDLEVYMKQFICIWIPTKRAGLWTHMVYLNCCNHLWVLRLELNMYENEWKDPDLVASNRDSFWCDSIICSRLCIPTEFRRIPAEFRHKAPAVPVPDRKRRNVL
jgi:hypothetical protein